jgi:purine-binding chemotaxis protein CheW
VERVVPIALLARPPGLPAALEGVLNLGGTAVSVLRLDRLLGLPARDPGLYSMLILLKRDVLLKGGGAVAVLVDRVREVLSVPEGALLAVNEADSLRGCARAAVSLPAGYIHVLASERLLFEKEEQALSEFQAMAEQRFQHWEVRPE